MTFVTFLLLSVLLSHAECLSCKECIQAGKSYFIDVQDNVYCESVERNGKKSDKFTAVSFLECDLLESVMKMVGAPIKAASEITTEKRFNRRDDVVTKGLTELGDTKTEVAGTTRELADTTTELGDTTAELSDTTNYLTKSTTSPTMQSVRFIEKTHEIRKNESLMTRETSTNLTTELTEESIVVAKNRGRRFKINTADNNSTSVTSPLDVFERFDQYIERVLNNMK